MIKKIKKNLFGFILGLILVSSVTIYAVSRTYANNVNIDTTNISELSSGDTLDTALTKLYEKSTTCPAGYKCYDAKFTPEVGDYVRMTPTKTSYTTDTSKTGYSSTQTIDPSELNLWRVIKVNSDGTIEMVSEHVSSTYVYFKGQTGYKNLVGYLNVLANQYQNSKYTVSARHMGYNGQTEYLTDTANTVDSTATTPPWTCSTGGTCNPIESKGGGDTLYTKDTELVQGALGTLTATRPSGSSFSYWLASRYYYYFSSTFWSYRGRNIRSSGGVNYYDLYIYISGFSSNIGSNCLRPIVTLKSGINYTKALGTSDDPFVLD